MEILIPGVGLIIWTALALVNIIFCIIAIIKLSKHSIDPVIKSIWLLAIILLPFIGALTFFAFKRRGKLKTA
jgi:cytochrome bd-type quinol oxidase subunit 2